MSTGETFDIKTVVIQDNLRRLFGILIYGEEQEVLHHPAKGLPTDMCLSQKW